MKKRVLGMLLTGLVVGGSAVLQDNTFYLLLLFDLLDVSNVTPIEFADVQM
ncbi:hypothetical protein GCM10008018_72050 [Paenibacillus marchantiophytorum]|uniref:Uncharacterized protein n=1 Tax=Paenibacillus marchantiophytorum TaxID=1619310 RepID=A0ABQ1FJB9_9BACL|nr:hypothetical protein [Paenibacillus marchantiophytorum]GGA17394.1 hypothetical protein GCM10008018_72050 [Paenibacillus marchantiophytorum]